MKPIDHLEAGLVFGRWTVIGSAPSIKGGRRVNCRCSCGTDRVVFALNLVKGLSTSCGCLKNEKLAENSRRIFTKHGMTDTPEYRSWSSMIDRCENTTGQDYERYGARGITVCHRWRWGTKKKTGFEYFYGDMGHRPEGRTLERLHNDKGYAPWNCAWGTKAEQANNQRPKRKKIPEKVKDEVWRRQNGHCLCGAPLGTEVEYDHRPALISRTVDYQRKVYLPDQLDPKFIDALHPECHLQRTVGRKAGAAKTVTTIGSDSWLKSKFNRLEGRTKKRPKQKIPARKNPWPKRKLPGCKSR